MEQGDPIRLGIPGIALWERARTTTDEPAMLAASDRIRKFLLNEGRVSAAVQAFLRETDGPGIWERLISRVEWDTDAAASPEVIKQIEDNLIVLGQSRGIPAREAEKGAAHLYEATWAVATARDRDRSLVRADALRIFDERTRVSLPQTALSRLLSALPEASGSSDLGALLPLPVVGKSPSVGRAPTLQIRHHRRPDVVVEIRTRLAEKGRLVLYGATSTGKSSLAAEYIPAATEAWGWVNLRGVDYNTPSQRLASVINDLQSEKGISNIVLNDLELPEILAELNLHVHKSATSFKLARAASSLPQILCCHSGPPGSTPASGRSWYGFTAAPFLMGRPIRHAPPAPIWLSAAMSSNRLAPAVEAPYGMPLNAAIPSTAIPRICRRWYRQPVRSVRPTRHVGAGERRRCRS